MPQVTPEPVPDSESGVFLADLTSDLGSTTVARWHRSTGRHVDRRASLGSRHALPNVGVTRAGRTADRIRKQAGIGHEVEATGPWLPERTRPLPSRARTTAARRWAPSHDRTPRVRG